MGSQGSQGSHWKPWLPMERHSLFEPKDNRCQACVKKYRAVVLTAKLLHDETN